MSNSQLLAVFAAPTMTNKKKGNKYEKHIDAEIDLHGYTVFQAQHAVKEFISDAHLENLRYIRIIVGKGNRSPEGSVLGPAIKSYLNTANITYSPAKQSEGGDGALIISL